MKEESKGAGLVAPTEFLEQVQRGEFSTRLGLLEAMRGHYEMNAINYSDGAALAYLSAVEIAAPFGAELVRLRAEVERLTENVAGLHKSCNLHAVSAHEHRQRADQAEAEVERLSRRPDSASYLKYCADIADMQTLFAAQDEAEFWLLQSVSHCTRADLAEARVLRMEAALRDLLLQYADQGFIPNVMLRNLREALAAATPPDAPGEGSGE